MDKKQIHVKGISKDHAQPKHLSKTKLHFDMNPIVDQSAIIHYDDHDQH